MYSFDNTDNSYKYESIQHGYAVEYYEEEEPLEIFLEEMLELENEMELEELAEAI